MLKNYFKIAWRNLLRSKTYSVLLLASLSIGMTCALALALYVYDELHFDGYHQNAESIYRINLNIKWEDNEYKMAQSSAPFGPALQQEYPQISKTLRVKPGSQTLRNKEKQVNVKSMIYADSTLFSFFDYRFLEGNAQSALAGPNNVVLTRHTALALFGRTSGLLGKTVMVKENMPFTVSGVMEEVPANHHLQFDAILPYTNQAVSNIVPDGWGSFNSATYVLLNNKQEAADLESKMPAFYKKYIARMIGDDTGKKVRFNITFQPLRDIHLRSAHLMGEENGSTMRYVYTISVIGLFILFIAVVNYVNLATARSIARTKEIGVRKAVGSRRSQLIGQFLTESLLLSFLAGVVSLCLLYVLLPVFNQLADKTLVLSVLDPENIVLYIGFIGAIGLISGFYPAFILSGFKPVVVMKGISVVHGGGFMLRKSLVVVQFSISMIMIFGTIMVYRQLRFMEKRELGFNQEQVIIVPLNEAGIQQSAGVLKNTLLQSPLISGVSLTNGVIGDGLNNKSTFSFYSKGVERAISTEYFNVDDSFLDVLKIRLKEGSNFSEVMENDTTDAVLVNQAMIRRLGWKNRREGLIEIDENKVEITGVMEDFHVRSLHNQIDPLVLVLKKQRTDKLLVRISGHDIPAALGYAKKVFEQVNPGAAFDYSFLDQTFARQYQSDQRKGTMFLFFSGIAIIIACMGLFGLATFTAQQRRKEIGVRKVLGASVSGVVLLLSRDFLRLVLISIFIASPIGWYVMKAWLEGFAYKVAIEWWVFALSGLLSIVLAAITISFQSVKASLTNPVESLRSE
ncbi:hypothetical protein DYBT9275_02381 [Dyadobacter sp. CECT 9275]|uniref:ABC transport system permease protein n=1 Tax=Dyadobacter helix TaxID=2822344 RepID=A0A916JC34_9BACT|nr:ABC transporter permease [Dyadobacter sp. CECT 9275]CAG5000083.1 hypothetical protein DYBT9275_02381 [Dyadobacter sp. CECT 9275]